MNEIKESVYTNQQRILPEIKLKPYENVSKMRRFWKAVQCVCWSYADNTLQVVTLLDAAKVIHCMRIFWSTVIIVSFLIGAYLLAELLAQFIRVPFQITVGNPETLLSIPYPGISLCHPQTVINYKAKQFVERIRIPDGYDKTEVVKMLPGAIGVFTENQWGPLDANSLSTVNDILQLNGLTVQDVVNAVGINCTEFIRRCSFNKKRFPCFQDHEHFTFRETMTYTGVCCSFNYSPDNSSYKPLNVNSYGIRGGLSIIATSFPHSNDGTSGILFSDGFILLVHSSSDFPTETTSMALLEVGEVTSISIYPTKSTVSADVATLPLISRRCLTGSDVGLEMYRRAACATKCMTQYIYDKCECHPYYLPAMGYDTQLRNCAVTDGECFQRIYYDMKKVRCTACRPACEDVAYKISIATAPYNFGNASINPIYDQTNLTRSEFTAHIFFAKSTVSVRRTIISQSFIQLLCNFGGVFNLVLGVSVFSILELFYYFFYKIPQCLQSHSKIRPVITTIQSKNKDFK